MRQYNEHYLFILRQHMLLGYLVEHALYSIAVLIRILLILVFSKDLTYTHLIGTKFLINHLLLQHTIKALMPSYFSVSQVSDLVRIAYKY
jgi:hypothetical protein